MENKRATRWLVPHGETLEERIYLVRGRRVMLSTDLAELYGVKPKALVQAVKRNTARFPADFMFRLTAKEAGSLRSQIVTLKRGAHRKYPPYAFTEQGVAMLSGVLRSRRAVQVNVAIMRTFVKLRETLSLHKQLAVRLDDLERKIMEHDGQIQSVFDAIRQLMEPPEKDSLKIGFRLEGR